jgi:hypothetical protein
MEEKETTMIELTEQQRQAVRNGEAVRVAVPELGEDVVLQRVTEYEKVMATVAGTNGAQPVDATKGAYRLHEPGVVPQASEEPLLHREDFLKLSEDEQTDLVVRDMWWAHDCVEARLFDAYLDQYVAVSGQRLLGAGPDEVVLREELAQKYDLDPFQLAIISGPRSKYYGVELGRAREL